MKLFTWNKGRQKSGYSTFPLVLLKGFDAHILYYPEGSRIPVHKDCSSDDTKESRRINIELWKAKTGGIFRCDKAKSYFNRIFLFSPSNDYHNVTRVVHGCRVVFSVGWMRDKL